MAPRLSLSSIVRRTRLIVALEAPVFSRIYA